MTPATQIRPDDPARRATPSGCRATVLPRRPSSGVIVLAGLAVLSLSTPGWSQPRKPSKDRIDKAKYHFKRGRAYHDLGEWDKAAKEYLRSYDLNPLPTMLFNVAQVYRLEGDNNQALDHYERYIALEPKGEGADLAREYIVELRAALAAEPAGGAGREPVDKPGDKPGVVTGDGAKTPAVGVDSGGQPSSRVGGELDVTDPVAPAGDDLPRPSPGRTFRIVGLLAAGTGVVLLGVGVKFAVDAGGIEDELEDNEQPWNPTLDRRYRDGEAAGRNAPLFGGVGVAAIVTGGLLYYFGRQKAAHERPLVAAPTLSPAHVGVTLRGNF